MWWAINDMSKKVQELVQEDASIDDREDTEPMPTNFYLAKEEPVLATKFAIDPKPNPKVMGSTMFHQSFTIPKEEVASVKDSMTSGLLT